VICLFLALVLSVRDNSSLFASSLLLLPCLLSRLRQFFPFLSLLQFSFSIEFVACLWQKRVRPFVPPFDLFLALIHSSFSFFSFLSTFFLRNYSSISVVFDGFPFPAKLYVSRVPKSRNSLCLFSRSFACAMSPNHLFLLDFRLPPPESTPPPLPVSV